MPADLFWLKVAALIYFVPALDKWSTLQGAEMHILLFRGLGVHYLFWVLLLHHLRGDHRRRCGRIEAATPDSPIMKAAKTFNEMESWWSNRLANTLPLNPFIRAMQTRHV